MFDTHKVEIITGPTNVYRKLLSNAGQLDSGLQRRGHIRIKMIVVAKRIKTHT